LLGSEVPAIGFIDPTNLSLSESFQHRFLPRALKGLPINVVDVDALGQLFKIFINLLALFGVCDGWVDIRVLKSTFFVVNLLKHVAAKQPIVVSHQDIAGLTIDSPVGYRIPHYQPLKVKFWILNRCQPLFSQEAWLRGEVSGLEEILEVRFHL